MLTLQLARPDGGKLPFQVKEQSEGTWEVTCDLGGSLTSDIEARLTLELPQAAAGSRVLWPLEVGVMEQREFLSNGQAQQFQYVFRGAGRPMGEFLRSQRLALPMCLIQTGTGYLMVGSDAAFSAAMEVKANAQGQAREVSWSWRWLAEAGAHGCEKRQVYCLPVKSIEDGLDAWHWVATPGTGNTQWLHEIAWNHFDYLGKNGAAWFTDLAAIAAIVPLAQRHRVIVCLHGWYGEIGDYGYDRQAQKMKEAWTAFPFAGDERVVALGPESAAWFAGKPPSSENYRFRNTREVQNVPMSVSELRRRLAYAKDLGFRTALYHMTGMQAAGNQESAVKQGTGLAIPGYRWVGPDLIGESYFVNPLHPEVRDFVLNYTRALLNALGDLTDALVLDEAYYVPVGQLGPDTCRGYADKAQLTLIQELTQLCHAYRPDLAYLTADLLGHPSFHDRAFPYSLYADGIWHDAWFWPQIWDSVRFPTWTKVALCTTWAPITNQEFVKWGVIRYGSALTTANGCFGDDVGPAEYDAEALRMLQELWAIASGRYRKREITVIAAS